MPRSTPRRDNPTPTAIVSWRRLARLLLRSVLFVYVLLVLLLFFQQESLLFPGQTSQGSAAAQLSPPAGAELVTFSAGRQRITALYGPALTPTGAVRPDAAHCPTALYFYGNGTWLAVSKGTFAYLRKRGVNVLIPDYVGYGQSTGSAGETGCYATATAAYHYLTRTRRVPPHRLLVVGGSLGGAVAIDLAARKPVAALAAFNTFTSMTAMANRMMPWAPSWLLLRHRFESERKIRQVKTPVFLAAGEADTFIPPTMTGRLAAVTSGSVSQMRVPGIGHGDLPTNGTPEFDAAFQEFIERVRR